jgi:hypothetical protein
MDHDIFTDVGQLSNEELVNAAELNLSFPLPGTDPTYDKFLQEVAEKHRQDGKDE